MTPLLAVRLAAAGLSGGWIGLNTGAGAAAILAVSMATPGLGRRLGSFSALIVSIVVMALGVGLLPIWDSKVGWFLLRILIGAGIGVHWVISEVWINCSNSPGSAYSRRSVVDLGSRSRRRVAA